MANTKKRKKQGPSKAEKAAFRHAVAVLHKKGLVKKGAREQKMTRYMKAKVKELRPVLEGNATVVSVPNRKTAKNFSDKFFTTGKKVVVPKTGFGGKTRYSKKDKDIITNATVPGGQKITILAKRFDLDQLRQMTADPNINFSIDIKRAGDYEHYRVKDIEDLEQIFTRSSWRNFSDWFKYVNVEIREPQGGDEIDELENL